MGKSFVGANAEEIQVITTLWIDTFACETEHADPHLRSCIALSVKRILIEGYREEPRQHRHPADDCWRSIPLLLAAYRAGKRSA